MMILSWPLWVDGGEFPRVPFLSGLPVLPDRVSWVVLAGIVGTLAAASVGFAGRTMLQISLTLLFLAILQDQNRCQPWSYQFVVIGLLMAGRSRASALRLARWYVVGLYFYSGLSKLDASFCRELGPTFLATLLHPFGISTDGWPEAGRSLACLAMPGLELLVAMFLLFPSTRRIGVVGAIAQHLTLVFILGPWNLGHSTIVLIWNLALIVQDLILFWPAPTDKGPENESLSGRLAGLIFVLAIILPIFERVGFCDAWPGHALYASHAERSDIFLHEDDIDLFPESVRRHLSPSGMTSWRRLDLTGWSRELRGTPPYPSGRVGNAVAEFLAGRFGGVQPVRLVQWGRASFWDARRDHDESLGLLAIRARARRFWVNARPVQSEKPTLATVRRPSASQRGKSSTSQLNLGLIAWHTTVALLHQGG